MDEIQTVHGKLLFVIYELSQSRAINDRDKCFLKDMVIKEEPRMLDLIDSYNNQGTLLTLRNDVIQLLRSRRSESQSPEGDVQRDRRRRNSFSLTVTIPPKNIQQIEGRSL